MSEKVNWSASVAIELKEQIAELKKVLRDIRTMMICKEESEIYKKAFSRLLDVKLDDKLGKIDCDKCDLYGECDHQGAYQINGKWCYEGEDEVKIFCEECEKVVMPLEGFILVKRENLQNPYDELIKDLDYWIAINKEGISTLYVLNDLKSKYKKKQETYKK